jgi:hypothetical protein
MIWNCDIYLIQPFMSKAYIIYKACVKLDNLNYEQELNYKLISHTAI